MPAQPITDPDLLLQRFARQCQAFGNLSAEARIERYDERGVLKGRVTFLADPAGRIRADAWSPTDQHLATLTADEEAFFYFERGAPECLTGLSCPENLGRLLPVGLRVREAVRVLFGIPPVYPPTGPWTIAFDQRVGAYRLQSEVTGGGVQRLWILEDGTPILAELGVSGRVHYRVEFSALESHGGRRFPGRIRVQVPSEKGDVTIRYRDVALDVPVEPGDFDFVCPQGLPVRVVPCQDGTGTSSRFR